MMKAEAGKTGRQLKMKIIKVMILMMLGCFLSALNFPICGFAAEKSRGEDNIVPQAVYLSEHSSVYSYGGQVPDKEAAIKAVEKYLSSRVSPSDIKAEPLGYSYTLNGFGQTAYGNGYVSASFHSSLDLDLPPGLTTRVTVMNGSYSYTAWTGTSPQYNSDVVMLSDSWSWSGLGISVSIPPGVGFSLVGTTVTWGPQQVYNQWQMWHYFSGLTGSGGLTLFAESCMGSHRFQGNTWVTAYASNSMVV
ncbi:MAG: hypothetical protein NUV70_08760 [Caldiserica bacterium]|nr:hypothetical protein [Caldisericota bacterium]